MQGSEDMAGDGEKKSDVIFSERELKELKHQLELIKSNHLTSELAKDIVSGIEKKVR